MSINLDKSLILNTIKDHYSFKKDVEFARFLGIKPQTLASWHTRNTYDTDLLYAKCVGLDGNFLLSGSGDAFPFLAEKKSPVVYDDELEENIIHSPLGKFKKRKRAGLVAFYDVDFIGGDIATFENDDINPTYYMDIPEFAGCKAFRIYNDSMEKLIKSGSIVFGTEESITEPIEYGQIYGIIRKDGRRHIKYIRKFKEDPNKYFLLQSENSHYDDFEIEKSKIRSIWLIHGWLHKRT